MSIKRLINKVKAYKGHREKWDRVEELLVTVLAFRRAQKIASFIKPEKVDNDGRMRCQYKFTTITGRLASSENPCRSGQNLQNIDRSLKGLFLPDKGCVLLEADLSRAENRIVLCLTGDAELIRKARRMPDEGDDYREAGAAIYSRLLKRTVAPEELSNEQRYASKRVVLASGYGMTGRKLSDLFLKDGYAYTAKECDGFIDAYMDANPAILQWQKETRLYVARNRRLFNSWGRDIHFEFERMDDELFRRSYAWVPQGEVGELTKCWGVRDTYYWLRENKLKTKMNMTVHDSLVMSCPVEELYDVAKYIDVNFSRPRTYGAHLGRSVELAIPCEYKIGLNWKGEKSWMRLPQREEIEEQARLMLRAL